MTGPILCGVDFSDHSRRALALASSLGGRLDQPLVVATVLDSLLAQTAEAVHVSGGLRHKVINELGAFTAEVAPGSKTCVQIGRASHQLIQLAESLHASMLVIATQGLGAATQTWLGSTTQRVFRAARVPVLAVPPGAVSESAEAGSLPFNRIVCGVDFSPASDQATRAAVDIGRRLGMPVLLIHAVSAPAAPPSLTALAETAAKERLEEAAERLRSTTSSLDLEGLSFETQIGEPGAVLTQRVNEPGQTSLLVLGLGGHDPTAKPGTTAYRVLAGTRALVFAVPFGDELAAGR
jgi:nucleotide-binding universal stress UspA family protein